MSAHGKRRKKKLANGAAAVGAIDFRDMVEVSCGKDVLEKMEQQKKRRLGEQDLLDFVKYLEAGVQSKYEEHTKRLFAVSPCSITEMEFKLRFGLIRQFAGSPPYDSFRNKNMNMQPDAIKLVAALHQMEVLNSFKAKGDPRADRGTEDLVLCRFRYFTKPRSRTGTSDLLVVTDYGDRDRPARERGDFKVYVFKDGSQVLRMVVDCKTSPQARDILQAAMHAIPEDDKERCPVYLMLWSGDGWYHGILEIDGFVYVNNGALVEPSLSGFPDAIPAEQMDPNGDFVANFTPSATKAQIRNRYATWKVDMDDRKLNIPDGYHPVGKLFRIWEAHDFPMFSEDASLTEGSRLFYEGFLKILVGREVASWDRDKVRSRWRERYLEKAELKVAHKLCARDDLVTLWSELAEQMAASEEPLNDDGAFE
ncbi:hypothetical protein SELMODRAFT_411876 [Selaginella moellendorffii]|uniref:Uncharacterized protein n=1 Tax=Selaginella moellendorffii TaxID=88036 RepID=D8RJB3_SELML|nr:uncharacterized protein LOC9642522 [Selaginella moellendorffii]EFJ27681.1 hypothetical protein SELMODRAFT_411876 [Selaginella moellendorffii]|eukprot:XP_002971083.1 uncharacterized protein LOC9642522 [Selaginella moellendorffii]